MKKIKGKREKIDVILAVYTTKFELSIIFQNEKFTAWYIQGISKEELIEKFTKEEIEYIKDTIEVADEIVTDEIENQVAELLDDK